MSLGRARPDDEQPLRGADAHPGEPGVGVDLPAPFGATDEATRWLFGLNRFGIRPGLMRIEGLLQDLGHPERDLRTLVVAGTNGKGSTTRILARLLRDAGYKVATYTSPHLLNVYERILIDDRPVEAGEFARRVEAIRSLTVKHAASWFETLTALAVELARDEGVDYFCCETGLGGRLDASNALPAVATILTTVGLDHQKILGETLPEIAAEKLGLLKRGVPLFTGVDDSLRGQAFMAAVQAGSPCFFLDELARWPEPGAAADRRWDLTLRARILAGLPDPGTAAMRRNVALALLALTELESSREAKLLPDDTAASLRNLLLPGRYQQVLREPDWIFDTAHNTQALAQALSEFRRQECRGRRVVVFGGMHDKGLDRALYADFKAADHILALPVSLPRSRTESELRSLLEAMDLVSGDLGSLWQSHCVVAPDMTAGLQVLAAGLQPGDRVLVTGSCFTVAEVLHRMGVTDLEQTRQVGAAAPVLKVLQGQAAPARKDSA